MPSTPPWMPFHPPCEGAAPRAGVRRRKIVHGPPPQGSCRVPRSPRSEGWATSAAPREHVRQDRPSRAWAHGGAPWTSTPRRAGARYWSMPSSSRSPTRLAARPERPAHSPHSPRGGTPPMTRSAGCARGRGAWGRTGTAAGSLGMPPLAHGILGLRFFVCSFLCCVCARASVEGLSTFSRWWCELSFLDTFVKKSSSFIKTQNAVK